MSIELDQARLKGGARRTQTVKEADYEKAAETLLRIAKPFLRSHPSSDALKVANAIDAYFAKKS